VVITADVSEPYKVRNMVRRGADELGQLDAMAANAGIAQIMPFLDLTPEDWGRTMSINLRGVFLWMKVGDIIQ
jgi:meso-butanediol dehydrogenase/(S,S)-butanediol dehydrogenase/diacetyl reductase